MDSEAPEIHENELRTLGNSKKPPKNGLRTLKELRKCVKMVSKAQECQENGPRSLGNPKESMKKLSEDKPGAQ